MSLSAIGSELSQPGHDPDRLLAGYRAACAQEALFDMRGNGPLRRCSRVTGYDEFVDATGDIRPSWRELGELIGGRGRAGLDQMRSTVASLVDNRGISYVKSIAMMTPSPTVKASGFRGHGSWTPCRCWSRPPTGTPWNPGWCSGTRLLDAVLSDLYGPGAP